MASNALRDFGKTLSNSPIPSRGLFLAVTFGFVGISLSLTAPLGTSLLFVSVVFAFPVTFATSLDVLVGSWITFSGFS